MRSTSIRLTCLGLVLLLCGCDSGPKRYAVTGSVTLKGQPLDSGVITFVPDGGSGQPGSAVITNGKYSISGEHGLLLGKYKVALSAPDGKTPDLEPGALPGPSGNFASKDRIPDEFNAKSKLEFEVKATAENVFNCTVP
jgi:hypothetical protein